MNYTPIIKLLKKKPSPIIPLDCSVCGSKFKPRWGKVNKYCSHECYWKDMSNRRGSETSHWKGDKTKYDGIHKWFKKNKEIVPCEFCGSEDKGQWANISGQYLREDSDWLRLCRSCHQTWDRVAMKAWSKRRGETRQIALCDFDGVIHRASKGNQNGQIYDPPMEGAVETITNIIKGGWEVVIFTAREPNEWRDIVFWLRKYGFPGMRITNIKIPCRFYIDDRAIRFTNWADIAHYLL